MLDMAFIKLVSFNNGEFVLMDKTTKIAFYCDGKERVSCHPSVSIDSDTDIQEANAWMKDGDMVTRVGRRLYNLSRKRASKEKPIIESEFFCGCACCTKQRMIQKGVK